MPDPKGDILYVKLAASQTRRRLEGFGHGVRKVQSAGRNRAAIIHTATGHHLDALRAKFADVGYATRAADLDPAPTEDAPHDLSQEDSPEPLD